MILNPLLILAGGRATRLGDLSEKTPKFLMPIDSKTVFADLQLEWAAAQGFQKVILSVGYLGEKIQNYCQDGKRWGLDISYSFDGPVALGTGGAVKKALKGMGQSAAVTYGDTLLALNAADLFNKAQGSEAFMTVYKNKVSGHVCNAHIAGDSVQYSKSQPRKDFLFIDYGFLILSPNFVGQIPDSTPLDLALPLEKLSDAGRLKGCEIHDRFWEMGSLESLEDFKKRYAKV